MNSLRTHIENLKRNGSLRGIVSSLAEYGSFPLGTGLLKNASLLYGLRFYCVIGGCEAVRDIYDARTFGVDGLIAPMIDSRYALEKFVESAASVYEGEEYEDISLGVVFSSVESIANAGEILSGECSARISFCAIDCRSGAVGVPISREMFDDAVSVIREKNIDPMVLSPSEEMLNTCRYAKIPAMIAGIAMIGVPNGGSDDKRVIDDLLRLNETYIAECSGTDNCGGAR